MVRAESMARRSSGSGRGALSPRVQPVLGRNPADLFHQGLDRGAGREYPRSSHIQQRLHVPRWHGSTDYDLDVICSIGPQGLERLAVRPRWAPDSTDNPTTSTSSWIATAAIMSGFCRIPV